MHGGSHSFFGLINTCVVRHGSDVKLYDKERRNINTRLNVMSEMILQICTDYAGLPDPRTLSDSEIRFFYEGARATLKKHTTPTEES